MNRTKIEWVKNPDGTQGYTWNPITGCLNGCDYCYARKLANGRLKPLYLANKNLPDKHSMTWEATRHMADPFYPRFWEERVFDGRGLFGNLGREPKGVFVCDMGELFGDWILAGWQDHIFNFIKLNPIHRFYLLTKQPQNLIKFSPFPDNCWVGVTVTDALMASTAEDALAHIEARVKYISFEPLLSRIENPEGLLACLTRHIDWVIIGAQTKPYKPPKIEWVREIVEACDKAGIPVFIKHNMNSENLPDNAFDEIGLVRHEMPEGRWKIG